MLVIRVARKDDQAREGQRKALGLSEDVRLLSAAPSDAAAAALVVFGDPHAHLRNWRKHRSAIQQQDIFRGELLCWRVFSVAIVEADVM